MTLNLDDPKSDLSTLPSDGEVFVNRVKDAAEKNAYLVSHLNQDTRSSILDQVTNLLSGAIGQAPVSSLQQRPGLPHATKDATEYCVRPFKNEVNNLGRPSSVEKLENKRQTRKKKLRNETLSIRRDKQSTRRLSQGFNLLIDLCDSELESIALKGSKGSKKATKDLRTTTASSDEYSAAQSSQSSSQANKDTSAKSSGTKRQKIHHQQPQGSSLLNTDSRKTFEKAQSSKDLSGIENVNPNLKTRGVGSDDAPFTTGVPKRKFSDLFKTPTKDDSAKSKWESTPLTPKPFPKSFSPSPRKEPSTATSTSKPSFDSYFETPPKPKSSTSSIFDSLFASPFDKPKKKIRKTGSARRTPRSRKKYRRSVIGLPKHTSPRSFRPKMPAEYRSPRTPKTISREKNSFQARRPQTAPRPAKPFPRTSVASGESCRTPSQRTSVKTPRTAPQRSKTAFLTPQKTPGTPQRRTPGRSAQTEAEIARKQQEGLRRYKEEGKIQEQQRAEEKRKNEELQPHIDLLNKTLEKKSLYELLEEYAPKSIKKKLPQPDDDAGILRALKRTLFTYHPDKNARKGHAERVTKTELYKILVSSRDAFEERKQRKRKWK